MAKGWHERIRLQQWMLTLDASYNIFELLAFFSPCKVHVMHNHHKEQLPAVECYVYASAMFMIAFKAALCI